MSEPRRASVPLRSSAAGKLTQSRAPQTEGAVAIPSTANARGRVVRRGEHVRVVDERAGRDPEPVGAVRPADDAVGERVPDVGERVGAAGGRGVPAGRPHRRLDHEAVDGEDARDALVAGVHDLAGAGLADGEAASDGDALMQRDGGGTADEVGEGAGREAAVGVAAGAVHAGVDEERRAGLSWSCGPVDRRGRLADIAGTGQPRWPESAIARRAVRSLHDCAQVPRTGPARR